MRAGRLRHRVELQRAEDGIDGYGEQTPTWRTLATVWAAIEPLTGREYFLANQNNSEVSGRITLRALPDFRLTPKDRVRYGTRLFDIQSVIERDERSTEWELMVIERVS